MINNLFNKIIFINTKITYLLEIIYFRNFYAKNNINLEILYCI